MPPVVPVRAKVRIESRINTQDFSLHLRFSRTTIAFGTSNRQMWRGLRHRNGVVATLNYSLASKSLPSK
jgi:hypothetical protein